MSGGRVYRRDASWHVSPGRGGTGSHGAFAYHWPSEAAPGMARCQPNFTMLLDDAGHDPAEVLDVCRCRRPGCRQQWAMWLARVADAP